MKKILTLLIVLFTITTSSFAQNTIGLRLGGGSQFGAEASYQHVLGSKNRLELDLGIFSSSYNNGNGTVNVSGFKLTGLYQWILPVPELKGFKWYFGAGISVGNNSYSYYKYKHVEYRNTMPSSEMYFGIPLNIGIEYHLTQVPFNISLDYRPEIGTNFHINNGIALGIRYIL
ncbi:MAG: hypothetical protein KAG96_02095 [Ichthyobacteriaceae bacterium]|nr:hypothetical protein [Ichthyobacteriaceae bacterium]